MGICLSCLGLARHRQQADDIETRGLLYDDPYRSGGRYGAVNDAVYARAGVAGPFVADPESARREREMLEGICHTMSDHVIDVFTSQPQPSVWGVYGRDVLQPKVKYSTTKDSDRDPRDLSLRTIKKGRAGPVFSFHGQEVLGTRAVQEAIG